MTKGRILMGPQVWKSMVPRAPDAPKLVWILWEFKNDLKVIFGF